MTHGDCASAGQCRLDGAEKSNGAVGVTAEYKWTFFPLSRWRNLHTAGFFVSTLTMPIMEGGGCFAHNI